MAATPLPPLVAGCAGSTTVVMAASMPLPLLLLLLLPFSVPLPLAMIVDGAVDAAGLVAAADAGVTAVTATAAVAAGGAACMAGVAGGAATAAGCWLPAICSCICNCCKVSGDMFDLSMLFSSSKLEILSISSEMRSFNTSTSSRTAIIRCDLTKSWNRKIIT